MGWVGAKVKEAIAKVGFDVVNNGVKDSMKKWFTEQFQQYLDSAGASAQPDTGSPTPFDDTTAGASAQPDTGSLTPFDDTPQQQCFASVFELLSSLGITKIEESALQKMASELEECDWSCADLLITDTQQDDYVSAVSMFELCESITKKDAARLRTKLTKHSEGFAPSAPSLLLSKKDFDAMDTNGDGQVSTEEFVAAQARERAQERDAEARAKKRN